MTSFSPRTWRLATRLTVAVVGLLVLLQLIVLATYAGHLQERREAALENSIVVGRTLAAVVDGFTRDLESVTLAAALALGANPEPLDQAAVGPSLNRMMTEYSVLRALFLTDVTGRVVATESGVGLGLDLSARPYIVSLRQGARMAWSDGLSGLESGETTVAFARVVPARDGSTRGYLVAAFYPERLLDRLPGGLPSDATFVLTDRLGFVLYSPEPRSVEEGNLSGVPEVRAALAGRIVPFYDAPLPFPGEAQYGAFIPVQHVGWVAGFARPQGPLDAQLRDRFVQQGGAITLVMLLAVTATAVFARRLATPLEALALRAGAIARGEHPASRAMDDADVEVVQLANAMTAMDDAVAERERALREVAAREQAARAEAEAAAARARAVQSVTDAALAHLRLEELLDELLNRVREALKVDMATILLVDPEGQNLRAAASKGLEEEVEKGIQVPVGQGFAGRIAAEQRPVILHDVEAGAVYSPVLRQAGLRSLLGVPLLVEGRLVGVLQVGSREARAFDVGDASLLHLVADRAALALDHARLFRETQEAVMARDEFLSVAAHELRTPMTSVRASAQLLLRQLDRPGGPDEARLRQMLGIIEGQSERLARLVAQLLDVSRIQSGRLTLERETVDLVGLVEGVAAGARMTASTHTIAVHAPNELMADVDPLRFEQVVTNLLDNAVKYSPDGEAIEVELSQPSSGVARLTVTDGGDGIPAEHRERIFEPFFQAPSGGRSKGLGLGLYITKQTVELHGGGIEVESPPEGGTRFVVTVPIQPVRSGDAVDGDGVE